MSNTTYSIEFAKSGRSKCKKCKQPILKGDMRMCVVVPANENHEYDLTSYHHVGCFRMPRRFSTGASKMAPEDFVREYLTDVTENQEILPSRADEIADLIANSGVNQKGGKVKQEGKGAEPSSILARIKSAAEEEEAAEPKKKKIKKEQEDTFDKMVKAYKQHCKTKTDVLKDYLRWNKQFLTGKKEFVLFKVIDGEVNGRLGNCVLCGGRLKFQEDDLEHVVCNGRFDEDINMRLPCGFKAPIDEKTPRYHPWHSDEPTDEEKEAMEKQIDEARGEGGGEDNAVGKELLEQAEKMDWKMIDKQQIQAATGELLKLVSGKIDLPENKPPKMVLGPILLANRDKAPKEIVNLVIEKYGFKEEKEKKAAAKEAAIESQCANPKNAALLLVFQELKEFYFKEGNRNAGASYTKVCNALKDLKHEVTAKNAMSFSKGKTKIPGIGKGSAEKMKEFMETGTIQKLEEKRANNA